MVKKKLKQKIKISSREDDKRDRIFIFHTDHQMRWIFLLRLSMKLILAGPQMYANTRSTTQNMDHTAKRKPFFQHRLEMMTLLKQQRMQLNLILLQQVNLVIKTTLNLWLLLPKLRNTLNNTKVDKIFQIMNYLKNLISEILMDMISLHISEIRDIVAHVIPFHSLR